MAIALDSSSMTSAAKTSSPFTWLHAIGGGANRFLVVVVALYSDYLTPNCTGVTYDGVAMTNARKDAKSNTYLIQTSIWFLHNPATGTKTISVAATNFAGANGASASYTGAAQVSTADAVNGTTGTTSAGDKTTSVTTVADNSWVVAVGASLGYSTPSTVTVLQTLRQTQTAFSNTAEFAFEDLDGPKTPAGSQSMGFHIHSDDNYAISAASFAPVAESLEQCQIIII